MVSWTRFWLWIFILGERLRLLGNEKSSALFLMENVKPINNKWFNKIFMNFWTLIYYERKIHLLDTLFRSGISMLMKAAGFVPESIKAWGRWSSEAYSRYCKQAEPKVQVWKRFFQMLRLH